MPHPLLHPADQLLLVCELARNSAVEGKCQGQPTGCSYSGGLALGRAARTIVRPVRPWSTGDWPSSLIGAAFRGDAHLSTNTRPPTLPGPRPSATRDPVRGDRPSSRQRRSHRLMAFVTQILHPVA